MDMFELGQNEFGPKLVLACPLSIYGVKAFAPKWGSSASHKSLCCKTACDECVSLMYGSQTCGEGEGQVPLKDGHNAPS